MLSIEGVCRQRAGRDHGRADCRLCGHPTQQYRRRSCPIRGGAAATASRYRQIVDAVRDAVVQGSRESACADLDPDSKPCEPKDMDAPRIRAFERLLHFPQMVLSTAHYSWLLRMSADAG